MALTQPILLAVPSFDATGAYVFSFNVIGGDQVVKNTLTIKNNSTLATVYSGTTTTFQFTHTVPANTLSNGTTYQAYINTYNAANTMSANSNTILFTCYAAPGFAFTNIPATGIINNSSFNFIVQYIQAQSEALSSYVFTLYDSLGREVSTSGTRYTGATTVPLTINYTFSGFANNTAYSIQCTGQTAGGTQVATPLTALQISYSSPSSFVTLDIENVCDGGYVYVESNATAIFGTSNPTPPVYVDTNTAVDTTMNGYYVQWAKGFEINGDWTMSVWGRSLNVGRDLIIMKNGDNDTIRLWLQAESGNIVAVLEAGSRGYIGVSNSISTPASTDNLNIWVRRIDNIYEIKLANLTPQVTKYRVGGKIFYIDSTASGAEYTFYDQNEQEIENVVVGDEPYYYSVEGTPDKDKFYIVNLQLSDSNVLWTYYGSSGYVYNNLGTTYTLGSGKSNTQIVMSADGGAYIASNVQGHPTIWYVLKTMRDNELGGCSDWYVASDYETINLVQSQDADGNYIIPTPSTSLGWLLTSTEANTVEALRVIHYENRGSGYTGDKSSYSFRKFYPIRSF